MNNIDIIKQSLGDVSQFISQFNSINTIAPIQSLPALDKHCMSVLCEAISMGQELNSLYQLWQKMTETEQEGEAGDLSKLLLMQSHTVYNATGSFRQSTVDLSLSTQQVLTELDCILTKLNEQEKSAQQGIEQAEQQQQQCLKQSDSIKKQLSGASGFFHGLAEGLSLGIYHEPTDQLSNLKELYKKALQQQGKQQRNCQQYEQSHKLLIATNQTLAKVTQLSDATVPFENAASSLYQQARLSAEDGQQIQHQNNQSVVEYYRRHLTTALTGLLEYRAAFNGLNFPTQLNPTQPIF